MKKFKVSIIWIISLIMVLQVILPTISYAADYAEEPEYTIKLNIQEQRPYNDDDGDGTVGNDIYSLTREAVQTVFKIGEQDSQGKLSFNKAYYCVRGGLGFGSTEEIVANGVDYKVLSNLKDSNAIIEYYKNTIGYDIPVKNYNAICWIADNMYLPKSEYAEEMKTDLLKKAGITSSELTDDDIEVAQQIALWYFSNYDENGKPNSLSLSKDVDLAAALLINGKNANNDTTVFFNKNRVAQIKKLYEYFINTAESEAGNYEANKTIVIEELELDKTLEPTIETKTIPNTKLNAKVVGPFKINEKQKGNIDYKFSYEMNYKTAHDQENWGKLDIDNKMGTVYLSDAKGNAIDNRNKTLEDMIAGEEFYITILTAPLNIATITDFDLSIYYSSYYYNTEATVLVASSKDQPVLKVEKEKIENSGKDKIQVKIEEKEFDLALRKFITFINGEELTGETSRVPMIYLEDLRTGKAQTATYEHLKNVVPLKKGASIVYTIRIYNESDVNGYVKEVTDYLCDDLELVENSSINSEYSWEVVEGTDGKTIKTNYLANTLIKAYDKEMTEEIANRDSLLWQKAEDGTDGLYYADLLIECRIKDTAKVDTILPNIAEITEDLAEGTDIDDRDSVPESLKPDDIRNYNYTYPNSDYVEDDDDYERVIIEPDKVFDLSLRKYIDHIERKGESIEFESRVPNVDTTTLKNGRTATYIHPKNALTVKQGDIITYKIRVYNEGELDGFVKEVTDYIPEGLGFLNGYSGNSSWLIDSKNIDTKPLVGEKGWYESEDDIPENSILANENIEGITIVTGKEVEGKVENLVIKDYTSLKDALIKKYGAEVEDEDNWQQSINDEDDGLFYEEIEVTCIVLAPNTWQEKITNIAEISDDKAIDETGAEVEIDDRDSDPDNVDLDHYEFREDNSEYQEDDDDYEPVQLKYFDLALRKFITGVNDEVVDTRIPEFYIDEDGNYKYRHDKTPVEVIDKDNVTYTIRVFNEGSISGYAEEIEDDIPEGLIFLPDNEINKEYRWKMYREVTEDEEIEGKNTVEKNGKVYVETEDPEEAVIIRTDYLSEKNGTIDEETGKNSNLLELFDKDKMDSPDYRDVKVVFKVSQADIPEENEDRIIINKAHITEDSDDDEDSKPNEWNEGEDDQDIEKVYVKEFDLSLFKWVTQTIVTVDGKTTTTETGFKPNEGKTEQSGENYRDNQEAEPIASVVIDKKKLKSTTVKFVYNIKVVNEGDIAGYATEITDYVPEGLKFVAEDNPLWTQAEDGKIKTRALETVLLEPGKSATVPVVFTWINDANNLGLKKNIAAITEDYNDKGVPDIDSKPGNEDIPNYDKEQEDDDDYALVILTLKTGKQVAYIGLILAVMVIITAGTITIKKYVL